MEENIIIEKAKILAERYLELNKELSEIKKEVKDLLKEYNQEVNERLSNGGFLIYEKPEDKEIINNKKVTALLFDLLIRLNNGQLITPPSEEEIKRDVTKNCVEIKSYNWRLKIKK